MNHFVEDLSMAVTNDTENNSSKLLARCEESQDRMSAVLPL